MRECVYSTLRGRSWDTEVLSFVAQIREHKGRQDLYLRQKPVELERLVEVAKIQSIDSSNRIEGIGTSNAWMKQLVEDRTTAQTRDEQEIVWYRDMLNTIHESYEHIPLNGDIILQLHRDLHAYTEKMFWGKSKNTRNYIN
jgi:Fic family protein